MSEAVSIERRIARRLLWLLPLVLFIALAALFKFRLGAGDPSRIPSALIGRAAPETNLPPVPGLNAADGKPLPGLSAADKTKIFSENAFRAYPRLKDAIARQAKAA